MNFWKEQRYQCLLQKNTQRIVELERERHRLFNELNETRVKYENLRLKHKDLCKSYNGLRKKYLKLKQESVLVKGGTPNLQAVKD